MASKIRFVTDSTCDLPAEIVRKYEIAVIPTFVNYGDKSVADNGVDLIREDFYRNLLSMNPLPTTSAMPPGLADGIIHNAFDDADHLFLIPVASKLSGVYNSMRLSAAKLPQDRVTLIDSKSVTMGLGFQVLAGAEAAEATGDVAQVKAAIEDARDHVHVYAALETMEFLRRSGRVGWGAASIGALLQIKPMLEVLDGEVKPLARVRTFSRAVEELIRLAHEQAPLERLAVLYISDQADADKLRDRLADIAPADTIVVSVTPTIGTHVGTGGLGVVTVSKH